MDELDHGYWGIETPVINETVERRWIARSELIGRWGHSWENIKDMSLEKLENWMDDEREMWAIGRAERRSEEALYGYEI